MYGISRFSRVFSHKRFSGHLANERFLRKGILGY